MTNNQKLRLKIVMGVYVSRILAGIADARVTHGLYESGDSLC